MAFRLPFLDAPALDTPAAGPARPELDLSGPALTQAFEALISGAEEQDGIESYASGLKSKAALFEQGLGGGRAAQLDLAWFKLICAHIAPVRRRVGASLERRGFEFFRAAIAGLLDGAEDTATADLRIAAFGARFPADREHRWVRDLAAELLHTTYPEPYPLMCRWVWLTGGVQVRSGATIGANAVINPNLKIGRDAVVGSGAVVIRDVDDGQVVAGNPARPLERRFACADGPDKAD